jgi:hypothetical protein
MRRPDDHHADGRITATQWNGIETLIAGPMRACDRRPE